MLEPFTITVSLREAEDPPSKIQAVKLIRALGLLRPGIPPRLSLREAKDIADVLLDHRASVSFTFDWGTDTLAGPALARMFEIVDGPGDWSADELCFSRVIDELEWFANNGADLDLP